MCLHIHNYCSSIIIKPRCAAITRYIIYHVSYVVITWFFNCRDVVITWCNWIFTRAPQQGLGSSSYTPWLCKLIPPPLSTPPEPLECILQLNLSHPNSIYIVKDKTCLSANLKCSALKYCTSRWVCFTTLIFSEKCHKYVQIEKSLGNF